MTTVKAKALLRLPLTARERAEYLLFIATDEEAHEYLKEETRHEKSHV